MSDTSLSIDELAAKWDQIVVQAREINWGDLKIAELSRQFGLPWFEKRSQDRVADFIAYDAKRLVLLRGLGPIKIERLCDLLVAALETANRTGFHKIKFDQAEESATAVEMGPDPREALKEWSVPDFFPCRLATFSNRLLNFLNTRGVITIGDLLDTWMELGFSGLIQQDNVGKKTAAEVHALVAALQTRDHAAACQFIPLSSDGSGLSLSTAIAMIADGLSSPEADLMHQRLVVGKTLEDSAEGTGLTTERIRQYEAKLLARLRDRLEYFTESHSKIFDSCFRGDDSWFESIRPPRHSAIIESALEALFSELPQAVARRLNEESDRETLLEDARNHPELWFGGVPIDEFLANRIGVVSDVGAVSFLGTSKEFRINHATGTLHPRKTGLYRTTVAILALEDDPISLTWLVELLRHTGYHDNVSREDLGRHKWRWERTEGFPTGMILWSE